MRRRSSMTFPAEEYERRLRELRERMAQRELDAVIITDPENLMYLTDHQTTGYSFFQALIVPLEADSDRRPERSAGVGLPPRVRVRPGWVGLELWPESAARAAPQAPQDQGWAARWRVCPGPVRPHPGLRVRAGRWWARRRHPGPRPEEPGRCRWAE